MKPIKIKPTELSESAKRSTHSHLLQGAREAAGAGDAGVAGWGAGWGRAAAGLWAGPAPAGRRGRILKSWGTDRVSWPPRLQRWRGRRPGSAWPETRPSPPPPLDPPHLKREITDFKRCRPPLDASAIDDITYLMAAVQMRKRRS